MHAIHYTKGSHTSMKQKKGKKIAGITLLVFGIIGFLGLFGNAEDKVSLAIGSVLFAAGGGILLLINHKEKKKTSADQPGERQKAPPFYKKVWFWCVAVVGALVVLVSTGAFSGTNTDSSPSEQSYVLENTSEASGETDTSSIATEEESSVPAESSEETESRETPTSSEETDSTSDESIEESVNSQPQTDSKPEEESSAAQTVTKKYVGSTESDKYHSPGCRAAKTILPENEIWFASKEEAIAAGYGSCGICKP